MITPDNQIPLDDQDHSDDAEQQSQQDIHSNGFDDLPEEGDTVENDTESDTLEQAYDAAEPSYTLNLGDAQTERDNEEAADKE